VARATPRTSRRTTKKIRNRRGFTLLELTIVVTLIVLFAIAIAPSALSQQRSGAVRSFLQGVRRLASTARETAVSSKTTVTMTYDEAERRLVLSRQSEEDAEQETQLGRLTLPDEVEASSFRASTNDGNASEWSVAFYSDGTSDGGGVAFDLGGGLRSLSIAESGFATLVDGELPDTSTEKWEAGTYEQRL
jgi:prepilin-type N-terminal cleavage/methylation domain-containing protein